jgi:hypothetical protein
MNQASGGSNGPKDLVHDIIRRREQREQKSQPIVPPTSLMEVSANPHMPVPRQPAQRQQKRLRGAHPPAHRAPQTAAPHTVPSSSLVQSEATMQKTAALRRADEFTEATDVQDKLDCEQMVLTEIHIGDSYKVFV